MKQYKVIMFDWDGTLMDSTQSVIETIQETAREFNLVLPSDNEVKAVLGLPLVMMAEKLFGKIDLDHFAENYYCNYRKFANKANLFDDVKETLQALKKKGYLLTIATNKKRFELNKILDKLKIKDLFYTYRCGDDGFPKPDPRMLLDILQELGFEADKGLMVGDTECDLMAARDAKVDCVAVVRGIRNLTILSELKPVVMIRHLSELLNFL